MIRISKKDLLELVKNAYLEGCNTGSDMLSGELARDGYNSGDRYEFNFDNEFPSSESNFDTESFFNEEVLKNFNNF